MSFLGRSIGWLDDRTGLARFGRSAAKKVFPDHWSFLLGEVALFCFVILLATGIFLTFFYVPSAAQIPYYGPYQPLLGSDVSAAFNSVLNITFEVRAGLLVRQIHHWTALVFVGAIAVHMSRVFFTAAFRRPRDLNWVIGIGLLTLALAEGFTGYSLPDDLLSGIGLRIAYSALLSIPFLGPSLTFLLFGGEFPTTEIISRLFVIHTLLLPAIFIGAIALHIGLTWLQKHTVYKGPGVTERTVKGPPFYPVQVFRSLGLFFLTAAVLALVAGLVQINPVWLYGPFVPYSATVPAQPDWYVGWLEGALRLGPSFEPTIFGVTIPTPFIPGILVPGILFTILALWPFLERRFTHDTREHHVLDWPWESPRRTGIGAAILTFFAVQMVAGANDVLATFLTVQVATLTLLLQIGQFVLPIAVGYAVYRLCRARRDRADRGLGDESGIAIQRNASGGFGEPDEP
jgi:ubiquinol-cytochrome c reductase cytochrome b subunit